MFVIQRINPPEGFTNTLSMIHDNIDEAIEEAERLAKLHADKKGKFVIYSLKRVYAINGSIRIEKRKVK